MKERSVGVGSAEEEESVGDHFGSKRERWVGDVRGERGWKQR